MKDKNVAMLWSPRGLTSPPHTVPEGIPYIINVKSTLRNIQLPTKQQLASKMRGILSTKMNFLRRSLCVSDLQRITRVKVKRQMVNTTSIMEIVHNSKALVTTWFNQSTPTVPKGILYIIYVSSNVRNIQPNKLAAGF